MSRKLTPKVVEVDKTGTVVTLELESDTATVIGESFRLVQCSSLGITRRSRGECMKRNCLGSEKRVETEKGNCCVISLLELSLER